MTLLVDVADLSIGFNGAAPLVTGLDLRIAPGQCVALVGESGSGKSLTARSLLGLAGFGAKVGARRLLLRGEDALHFDARAWRRLRGTFAGLVMQDALVSLDPLRTVGDEVAEPLLTHRLVASREEARTRVAETLAAVGMPNPAEQATHFAHELSGGLRQRALIAAAIAGGPPLIIADEPTTALDMTVQAQVLDVLRERLRQGAGLLLISHDLTLVGSIADHVQVLRQGSVVEAGPPDQVLGAPAHAYTRQLLAALPSVQSRNRRLTTAAQAQQPTAGRTPPDASAEIVLQARGLSKNFRRSQAAPAFTALRDVSFDIRRGEVLGIVGESGSGKSTCAKIVLGLLPPDAGQITFFGQPWANVPERQRRALRRQMQYIPQDALSSFDPRYTVRDIVGENLPAEARSRANNAIVEALEEVGLGGDYLRRHPRSLSGGQRQRVAIARSIICRPALVICDEPVSALDVSVQAQVLDLLTELRERKGMALLFVSHDLGVIEHLSDRVLVFHRGEVVEEGLPETIFRAPGHEFTQRLVSAFEVLHQRAAA